MVGMMQVRISSSRNFNDILRFLHNHGVSLLKLFHPAWTRSSTDCLSNWSYERSVPRYMVFFLSGIFMVPSRSSKWWVLGIHQLQRAFRFHFSQPGPLPRVITHDLDGLSWSPKFSIVFSKHSTVRDARKHHETNNTHECRLQKLWCAPTAMNVERYLVDHPREVPWWQTTSRAQCCIPASHLYAQVCTCRCCWHQCGSWCWDASEESNFEA